MLFFHCDHETVLLEPQFLDLTARHDLQLSKCFTFISTVLNIFCLDDYLPFENHIEFPMLWVCDISLLSFHYSMLSTVGTRYD